MEISDDFLALDPAERRCGISSTLAASPHPRGGPSSRRTVDAGRRQAVDASRHHTAPTDPDHTAEAAQLVSDLAALVDAGLVVVYEEVGGLARYALSSGSGDPGDD